MLKRVSDRVLMLTTLEAVHGWSGTGQLVRTTEAGAK